MFMWSSSISILPFYSYFITFTSSSLVFSFFYLVLPVPQSVIPLHAALYIDPRLSSVRFTCQFLKLHSFPLSSILLLNSFANQLGPGFPNLLLLTKFLNFSLPSWQHLFAANPKRRLILCQFMLKLPLLSPFLTQRYSNGLCDIARICLDL